MENWGDEFAVVISLELLSKSHYGAAQNRTNVAYNHYMASAYNGIKAMSYHKKWRDMCESHNRRFKLLSWFALQSHPNGFF